MKNRNSLGAQAAAQQALQASKVEHAKEMVCVNNHSTLRR